MKKWKLFLSLILGVSVFNTNAQTPDEVFFDKGCAYFEANKNDSALIVFRDLKRLYPQSESVPRADYNIAFILKEQGDIEAAKSAFKAILSSNYNDKDRGSGGIMDNPYALYKHNSCEILSELYLVEKNYAEAEKYIKLFDKKYPYQHFCGNEWSAYNTYKAKQYAIVYDGQGQTDKAIGTLLPYVFADGLSDNEILLTELYRLLEKKYTAEAIKKELLNALQTLKIVNKRDDEFATIVFFGQKVAVNEGALYDLSNPNWQDNMDLKSAEKYRKAVLISGLYKRYEIK